MEIDIQELTRQAFGLTAVVLPSLMGVREQYVAPNGASYFMVLKLADKLGNIIQLPNEPLVSLSLRKTIVETATVGRYRKGTVKEYINTEDYNINIKGVCVDDTSPNTYPATQVRDLNDLFALNEPLEIVDNTFFELFGIRKIVLSEIDFEDMAGYEGVQKYAIRAVSDQDFYAELADKQNERRRLLG